MTSSNKDDKNSSDRNNKKSRSIKSDSFDHKDDDKNSSGSKKPNDKCSPTDKNSSGSKKPNDKRSPTDKNSSGSKKPNDKRSPTDKNSSGSKKPNDKRSPTDKNSSGSKKPGDKRKSDNTNDNTRNKRSNSFKPVNNDDDMPSIIIIGPKNGFQQATEQPCKIKHKNFHDRIIASGMDDKTKEEVLFRLKGLDSDKQKQTEWFEGLLRIPFKKYCDLPIKMTDEKENITKFFDNAMNILDNAVYGMESVKEEIINYIAQFISTNNTSMPRIIGLQGNAGIGKTAIVRKGLSQALQKPMRCVSMGGIRDSSHFVGFDYSYAGSRFGIITQSLMEAGVMNPILFLDELDKISQNHDGIEVQNLLVHLTDPVQNNSFQDKYFAGINIDISKVMFIFSFNDENLISPILKDRIHIIRVPDPTLDQKIIIGKNYLAKEICENVGIKWGDIVISDDLMRYLINHYCKKDHGVRGLKRMIETLYLKINTARFLGERQKYKSLKKNIEFPLHVTEEMIKELLECQKTKDDEIISHLYL